MPRLEENRYLPVFALLALIITLQSFLIGEDKKQGEFDKPVISQATPFVTTKARDGEPRTPPSQNPQLAMARSGESAPIDMSGPQTADADSDAGWVKYQAGQSIPEDDLDEPPVMAPPSPTSGVSAATDDTSALAEETSDDDPVSPIAPGKDEWARPVPLGQIIEEASRIDINAPATAPRAAAPVAARAVPRSAAPSGVTTIEVDVGDNLWRIARRYNISGEEILRANKLTNGALLPGQVLVIPQVAKIALPPGFDVVHSKDGETAIDVANRVGVPLIDLVRENDLPSLYQIPAGTALRYRKAGEPVQNPALVEEEPPPPPRSTNPEKTGLMMPVVGKIGDRFGWRKHPILNETLFHTGLDLRAPRGEPIRSAQDGRIIYAGWLRGYGQTMVVRHVGGYTTRYAHCSQLLKKKGDKVKRGERIAKVGTSGMSTGPHVHFEVRLMGKPINPLKFLKRGNART